MKEKSFHLKHFEKVFVYTNYENPFIEKAIKKLKFRFSRRVLFDLMPFLAKHFPVESLPKDAVFIPVPLHFLRKNQRGFNQSELLAHVFSQICCGENRVKNLLRRKRNTPHQSHLKRKDRKQNVHDAFIIRERIARDIPLRTPLVLVDDVATTGFTLEECAKALFEYGYRKIYGLVIARGR